jgi:ankyrin repeat protein
MVDGNGENRWDCRNPLRAALQHDQESIVRLLLEHGADPNAANFFETALQVAVKRGRSTIVKLLLDHGADVNFREGGSGTALQSASNEGDVALIELLLDHGAEINAEAGGPSDGCFGRGTALQSASRGGHLAVVQYLLDHGADVNAESGRVGTALECASEEGSIEIVDLLLANGAHVNVRSLYAAARGSHSAVAIRLLESGAEVLADDWFLLHKAAVHGQEELVRMLMEKGVQFGAANELFTLPVMQKRLGDDIRDRILAVVGGSQYSQS